MKNSHNKSWVATADKAPSFASLYESCAATTFNVLLKMNPYQTQP